jgi:anti-anti-sigma factor
MTMDMGSVIARYNSEHPELTLVVSPVINDRVIVKVNGRLDLETSTHLKPIIDAIITGIPTGGLLTLDLEHIQYISSTGVGLLATILVQTIKQSKNFSLSRIQAPVQKVIELLGFSSFLNIEVPDA